MIFIGQGALLERAMKFAIARGCCVDTVVSASPEVAKLCVRHDIPLRVTHSLSQEWALFAPLCTDGILFSINNDQILRGPILSDASVRLFNIHNGLIPAYRGRPEVGMIFALLNQETEYGATLHEIDAGVDTGPTLDVLRFSIAADDDFESVMLKAIDACDELFRKNLASILASEFRRMPRPPGPSRLYRLRDLEQLPEYRDSPNLARATRFGVFQAWFPDTWRVVEDQLARIRESF